MMKKKSMAVAMAAVTVAMPASQVFAAVVDNTQTEEVKAMKEKALKLMNLKFTENKNLLRKTHVSGENVFNITLTTPGSADADAEVCTNYAEFERKFDKAYSKLEDGQNLKIGYEYAQNETKGDKNTPKVGYSVLEDGQVVDFKLEKYTKEDLKNAVTNVDQVGQVIETKLSDDGTKKYEVKLSNDDNGLARYKELKVDDIELDVNKPMVRQDGKYYVNVKGNAIAEAKDGDTVEFVTRDPKKVEIKITRKDGTEVGAVDGSRLENAQIDGFYPSTGERAETPEITKDVITKKGTQNVTLNATDLYNVSEGKVTSEGNELVSKISFYSELDALNQKYYGAEYRVENDETSKDREITIKVFKTEENSSNETKMAEIKIVRDNKDNKAEAYRAIDKILNADYTDKTRVAAGSDRYETAAEVSRMAFTGDKLTQFKASHEKAVVLVTGAQDKLVDGLTATPLAASLNTPVKDGAIDTAVGAPVLLTGNDKIAKPVLDEIERLGAKKVYIVGGAISESVEKQLKDVHGLDVDRVSGDDRYDTSMEVADKIAEIRTDGSKTDEVFVVGGKGEADALSAASAAAKEKAPILLTSKDKLSKDIKYFIKNKTANAKAHVVGGTSSVSQGVYNEILDTVGTSSKIERLAGDNRQDTNAKVVNAFFKDAKQVVVAKSDNKGMVDALGAGLYAGLNKAPVILATNNLTEDQEDYLNSDKVKLETANAAEQKAGTKVIVGNGISSTIAKFLKNLK